MATAGADPVRAGLSPLYYLHLAHRQMHALLGAAMAASPLDPTEFALYSLIFESGQATATQLARESGAPLTTVLDALRGLERRTRVEWSTADFVEGRDPVLDAAVRLLR